MMKKIRIEFRTLDVPAPFAHDYTLSLELDKDIKARYQINYKGRENLSEEEIIEEGYTLDDDFEWKGEINSAWLQQIESLLDFQSSEKDIERREYEIHVLSRYGQL